MEYKKNYKGIDYYCIKKLNEISNILILITKECEKFKNEFINGNYIKEIIKYLDFSNKSSDELQKGIEKYIFLLDSINDSSYDNNIKTKQKYYEEMKTKFKKYSENISKIYNNHLFQNIIKYYENLEELINDIEPSFEPPNINSFVSSKISIDLNTQISINNISENNLIQYIPMINEEYFDLCDKYNKSLSKNYDSKITEYEENIPYKCTICKENECKYICHDCNFLFCKKCYNQTYDNEKEKNNHKIQTVDKLSEIEKEKIIFLNSLCKVIKALLIKSNYLLNDENLLDNSFDLESNDNNNSLLKLKCINKIIFKYPYIREINNFESQIDYLKEMHNIIIKNFNNINVNLNSFHFSELNIELLNSIQYIFNDDKINNFKEIFDIIDNDFCLDDLK